MTKESVSSKSIALGSTFVGAGHPCLIVAEIGANHNRDLATAKRLIDVCQQSGVDAVKFQFYTPKHLIPRYLPAKAYGWDAYSEQYALDVFEHHISTPAKWFPELAQYVIARDLIPFAAVHDREWAIFAVELGFPVLKVASMEITNIDLIRTLAGMGKPLIMSTGMGHLIEIDRAVSVARQAGNRDLILFHCIANYPAQMHEFNLRQIVALRDCFDVPVGLSDHSPGFLAAALAVTQGACMIEKHVTLDRQQIGPDHCFALEPDELTELVQNIRAAEAALGARALTAVRADEEKRKLFLRSVVATRALPVGHVLEVADLTTKRPGTGIPPRFLGTLGGRELRREIDADRPIHWSDLK